MVYAGSGAAVDVEGDAEILERFLYHRVIAVHDLLRGDALFLCAYCDGYAVLVRSSDEDDVFFLQPQVSHIDICRDIDTGEVSDMYAAVGIGEGGSDGGSFVFFHPAVTVVSCFCGASSRVRESWRGSRRLCFFAHGKSETGTIYLRCSAPQPNDTPYFPGAKLVLFFHL